ncbi:MAG: hypothetical protein JJE08_11420 [Proteiniphilum sp.]|nr:hypothetical protein [Proteiniphilum sp.]
MKTFLRYPGVECISLCDVDDQWLYQRASDLEELTGKKPPQLVKDWRRGGQTESYGQYLQPR